MDTIFTLSCGTWSFPFRATNMTFMQSFQPVIYDYASGDPSSDMTWGSANAPTLRFETTDFARTTEITSRFFTASNMFGSSSTLSFAATNRGVVTTFSFNTILNNFDAKREGAGRGAPMNLDMLVVTPSPTASFWTSANNGNSLPTILGAWNDLYDNAEW